ncbi:MAG: DUF1648 domain-containing protein [Candidatus Aenigmatarchaeota archaeon]
MKAPLLIIALSFALALYFYPSMPERMASHWDASGQVNGYMPKTYALLLMPAISLVMYGLFLIIPMIDPLRKNIKKFWGYYENLLTAIIGFMFYIFSATIAYNLGYGFSMNYLIIPALSVLFYYIGVVMEHARRNWSIGIRTPWTISDDRVWKKTHLAAGKVFKASAVMTLFALFPTGFGIFFAIAPIAIGALALTIYSFLLYRKYHKTQRT